MNIHFFFIDKHLSDTYLSVETEYVPRKGETVFLTGTGGANADVEGPFKVVRVDCHLIHKFQEFYSAIPEVHLREIRPKNEE